MSKKPNINLVELLGIPKTQLSNYKLHLATGVKDKREPLYELHKGTFKEWQEEQSKKNFERTYILSLVYYARDEWLFAGIYKQLGVQRRDRLYYYKTQLCDNGKPLIGRLVVHFKRPGRAAYLNLENWYQQLEVIELKRTKQVTPPFPGYEKLIVDFDNLRTIVQCDDPDWKRSLSSVKGIYAIVDKTNGKIYIGSASGEESFWSRWSHYAKTGHGGNKELKDLIERNGIEYASNFQFAILEIRARTVSDTELLEREQHWKRIFLTNQFGYNSN